jgi:hypothetical protein
MGRKEDAMTDQQQDQEQDVWDEEHVDGSERGRTAGEDPGAYIGHEPERATETIPGGLGPEDERVAAVDTQSGATAGTPTSGWAPPPAGHREAGTASDDTIREAGQNE